LTGHKAPLLLLKSASRQKKKPKQLKMVIVAKLFTITWLA
jgi:hypothetical protein